MNKIKILFLCIFLVYIGACFIHVDARLPGTKKSYISLPKIYGGDEEHYLIMVSSIIEDSDLELRNNYYLAQYAGGYGAGQWWRGKYLDHHSMLYNPATKEHWLASYLNEEELKGAYEKGFIERPHHPPGMPAFASLFLWPFAHSESLESFAILFTMIFSLIGFYFLYKVLLYFYGEKFKTKCMQTVVFFALGTPLLFYGCSFFKENYVACFLILAIFFLFVKNRYFLSGLFICLCFFSKYQMIFVCLPLILYPLTEKNFKGLLAISCTVFTGGLLLLLYNLYFYGGAMTFSQAGHTPTLLKITFLSVIIFVILLILLSFDFKRKLPLLYKKRKFRITIKILGLGLLLFLSCRLKISGTPFLFHAYNFLKENYIACFLILAIFFLFVKNRYFLSGFFICLCLFAKYQMIFVCLPLILFPLMQRDFKGFLAISVTVFIGGLSLLLYNLAIYGGALTFMQKEYTPLLFKNLITLVIVTIILLILLLSNIRQELSLLYKKENLRITIKVLGIALFLYLSYKLKVLRGIFYDPKDGLLCFSPFLLFPIIELYDLRFWRNKKRAIITVVFLFYLVIILCRGLAAIGSAYSLRTAVSIIPLLSLPFLNWFIRTKKWALTKFIFIIFISFSMFTNTLAAAARIHFWHFPIKEAAKGALIDLFKWHQYDKINIELSNSIGDMVIFNPEYKILHPEYYNQEGKFSIVIKSPEVDFKRACLRIRSHVVYKNNYIILYASGKKILYLKGKNLENKNTKLLNITKHLKKNKKILLNGILFTDENTSVNPYDARIEEISLLYEKDNSIP